MAFTIKIEKPKNLQAVLLRAKNDAKKHNIFYEGDTKNGHGYGYGFDATYAVNTDFITIDVEKKPWFVSKARVEKEIRKYLSLGGA